jgi:tRNA 5-methylaminomethyl-2-thiouridine biosynthesis bifunctional protein
MLDEPLQWRDGQPWSARFGDRYFSADSGPDESRHVFLQGNGLAARWAALRTAGCFHVGETGFGTGLNFLCAWQLFTQVAPAGARLVFHSVERWPLARAELQAALALWPALQTEAQALSAAWSPPPSGVLEVDFGAVRLALHVGDVAAVLPQWPAATVDAWFLDGFAPARNPEMWSAAVLAEVARCARPGATLATYTSAGAVRRGLQAAGFAPQRRPGHGRKREMLVATRST